MKYNGWTNYETWCVNLWNDNDQGSQEYWREAALQCYSDAEADKHISRKRRAKYDLADLMKSYFEESIPEELNGLYLDMLNAALSDVNWDEIAYHLIDAIDVCECADPGCDCEGSCDVVAEYCLTRVDMDDRSGTAMCESCCDDTMESGLFSVKAI